MDYIDWTTYIAGGAVVLLIVGAGYARLSGAVEHSVSPLWQLSFVVAGGAMIAALVGGWLFPVTTTVYVANGSTAPRQVVIGDDTLCLPGKSYQGFAWRLYPPKTVTVDGPERETRYTIGKGTWLINTASTTISADMENEDAVAFDAVSTNMSGVVRVDSHFGRPLRMFSRSSFDRFYSMEGDVEERSTSGPCPKAAPADSQR